MPEFERRGIKPIGLSVDPVQKHHEREIDVEETQGSRVNFP